MKYLDIMVIKPHVPNRYEEMIRLRKAVGNIGAGIDLLVCSEAEYERRSQVPGTVLYWAREEGRPLYAAAHEEQRSSSSPASAAAQLAAAPRPYHN